MEKVLVMLLTAVIFFLGFLILAPDSKIPGNRYSGEEKLAITREFAKTLETDPEAPRWTGIRPGPPPPQPPLSQPWSDELRQSRTKNRSTSPLELPEDPVSSRMAEEIRQGGMDLFIRLREREDPGALLRAIETVYQNERNPEVLREVEAIALESIRRILREPGSPHRPKALKILETDLLPNPSNPDRKLEIEDLLNAARWSDPQPPQVFR